MDKLLRSHQIQLSPLRLHSASTLYSTVYLNPNSYNIFSRKPSICLSRTSLHSVSSVYIPNSTSIFNKRPTVTLKPLNAQTLNRYNIKLPSQSNSMSSGRRVFPTITKCKKKKCCTCKYLCCNSVIKSTTNGRNFSTKLTSDISWTSLNVVYAITWNHPKFGIDYSM